MTELQNSDSWKKLEALAATYENRSLTKLFQSQKDRFGRFSLHLSNMFFDYSKNNIEEEIIEALLELASERNLAEGISSLFGGEKINHTEDRAVLHTALRAKARDTFIFEGREIMPDVESVRAQMRSFSEAIRSGTWNGYSGKRITDIVNIGIGGSDLGPAMVCEALQAYSHEELNVHFVSNVDASHLHTVLEKIEPETSLFIIASKTFTTLETMTNARSAKSWFQEKTGVSDVSKHFVAVSTNSNEVEAFGIDPGNMFVFWDWVGGRYSVWSAIGLSICCYIGYKHFEAFLTGARDIDEHFRRSEFRENIPVLMALIGIWNRNFLNYASEAIIPYDQYLSRFPAYFQQGNMESNGKYVDRQGNTVKYETGPIVWGEPGTNGQHAFFQLLHQGTDIIPTDFLLGAQPLHEIGSHHDYLLANCLAQSEALFCGKDEQTVKEELETSGMSDSEIKKLLPYKVFEGGRPSNTIVYRKLSPEVLGSLIALYEHKIFVQGWIWNINSFDQWGVELGKQLAKGLISHLENDSSPEAGSASYGLLNALREL